MGLRRFFKKGDRVVFTPGTGRHPDLNAVVERYPGIQGSPHTVGIVLEGQTEVRISPLNRVKRRK